MEACSTPVPSSSDDCHRALCVPGISSHRGTRGLLTLRMVRHGRGTRRVPQRPGLDTFPGVRLVDPRAMGRLCGLSCTRASR